MTHCFCAIPELRVARSYKKIKSHMRGSFQLDAWTKQIFTQKARSPFNTGSPAHTETGLRFQFEEVVNMLTYPKFFSGALLLIFTALLFTQRMKAH